MCTRPCNDYPWYVNCPSDPLVHVQTSSVCRMALSPKPLLHMCRLMNSLSVCRDAVTRNFKCYLLGLPTLQIKPFPSPPSQIKAENLPAEARSKQDVAQRPVLAANSFSLIKVCHFLLLTCSYRQPVINRPKYSSGSGENHTGLVFSN